MAFVFYDTETTGTDRAFDQILQFAAIYTDDDFNELERYEVRCRLNPHVIPAIGALITNRVTPAVLCDPLLSSHYATICEIAAKFQKWSPAVFIGYNTLDFDENLLRQAFYQCLKPIYLTNTKGNRRADVLRLVQAIGYYAPNAIVVPIDENGKTVRKLDKLAPANGFAHEKAHDALGDVEATIFIAKLVREKAPWLWSALMETTSKQGVIDKSMAGKPLSICEFFYGKGYPRLVVGCGVNSKASAPVAVFDLEHDPKEFLGLEVDEIVAVMNGKTKEIRCLRANNQPIMISVERSPTELIDRISANEIKRRANTIAKSSNFQKRVSEAIALRFDDAEEEPSPYVEKRIYEGFPSRADEARLQKFHELDWSKRATLLEQMEDERFRELGYRLIYFERPEVLDRGKKSELENWHKARFSDAESPWLSPPKALLELEERLSVGSSDQEFLSSIRTWLSSFLGSK